MDNIARIGNKLIKIVSMETKRLQQVFIKHGLTSTNEFEMKKSM